MNRPPPRLPQHHPDDSDYDTDRSEDDFAMHNQTGITYQLDHYNSTDSEEEEREEKTNSSLAPPPVIAHPFPAPPAATDFRDFLTTNEYLLFTMCGVTGCIVLAGSCTLCRYCCRKVYRRQQRQPNPPYDDEQAGPSGSYNFNHHYPPPPEPLPPFNYGNDSFDSTFSNSSDEVVHMEVVDLGKGKGKGGNRHRKVN